MRARLYRADSTKYAQCGDVETGEYTMTFVPDTEEEKNLLRRLHRSVAGIKALPAGSAQAFFSANDIVYMSPDLSFHVVVVIKDQTHGGTFV